MAVQLISEYKRGSAELAQDLATKANVETALKLLSAEGGAEAQRQAFLALRPATPDDLVVLYIASHGYADPAGRFYVVPYDVGEPAGVNEELLDTCLKSVEQTPDCQTAREYLRRSISSDELTEWLQAIDAGQMVLTSTRVTRRRSWGLTSSRGRWVTGVSGSSLTTRGCSYWPGRRRRTWPGACWSWVTSRC